MRRESDTVIGPLFQSMRPHQWVKNAFVLAPVVFAQQLDDPGAVMRAVGATAAFCGASSAVYLMNDCMDAERDRRHPVKKARPIASGAVSERAAWTASVSLAACAVLGGFGLDWRAGAVTAAYLVLNVGYSMRLKHVAWLDVGTIALGFLLRVAAGAFAIDVPVSRWLFACTFLLALYLGLGKRRHELMTAGEEAEGRRGVLRDYRQANLATAMMGAALATVAAYSAYTVEPHTREAFGTTRLPYTVPFILFGLLRFMVLTGRADDASPTEMIVRDWPFVANVVAWGSLVLYLIYFDPVAVG